MAVTSVWRIKGSLNKLILYVENEDKTLSGEPIPNTDGIERPNEVLDSVIGYIGRDSATERKQFITAFNCELETAKEEMLSVKERFGKMGGVIAYHGYQSFAPGEVTPDKAHDIGKQLADEIWGENDFQVIVATHLDKENHIHNHFVVNTVSIYTGKKYRRTKKDYQKFREVSDRICLEHGLSVIHNPQSRGMNYGEWRAQKEGRPTVRGGIRSDIDTAIKGCLNLREFFDAMQQMGYIIDTSGKHAKIKPPDYEHFFRFGSLGDGYTLDEIENRVYNNTYREFPEFEKQELESHVLYKYTDIPGSFTIMGYRPLYQTYVYGLKVAKERPSSNKRIHWLLRSEIAKLDRYIFQSELLCSHNIDTAEQLTSFKLSLREQMSVIEDERRGLKNDLKRAERTGNESDINAIKEKIKNCTDRLKPLRKQVKACDEIFERSGVPREKLTELEEIFKRKEMSNNERISGSSGPNRQNVTQRR